MNVAAIAQDAVAGVAGERSAYLPAGQSRDYGSLIQSSRQKYSPYVQRGSYKNASIPHTLTKVETTIPGLVSAGDSNT